MITISKDLPLVSIGIPTFNRAPALAAAVRSALNQSYTNVEVIVSDNCSIDNTAEMISSFHDDRLRYVRHETNRGMVANFNACLDMASGAFFLMLSDDDTLRTNAIEKLVSPLLEGLQGASAGSIGMTWCPCSTVDSNGKELWTTAAGVPLEPSIEMLMRAINGTHAPRLCGFLLRADDARVVGGYGERYGPLCDSANWMQVAARYPHVACVQAPLANYTLHTASETSRSGVSVWLDGGANLLGDLRYHFEAKGDSGAVRRLDAASRNFYSGLIATVVLQRVGQRGWLGSALKEAIRRPQYAFTPYVARRLLINGWKLLSLSKRAEFQP